MTEPEPVVVAEEPVALPVLVAVPLDAAVEEQPAEAG